MRLLIINQSLWLDEAIGAIAVKEYSFNEILLNFIRFDNHPPLYYLLLKLWTSFFGYSELSLRMPSIIFGVLTIHIVYPICEKISGKKLALVASILLVTSQFHIYYSQEARMYSMATFFAALAIYEFIFLVNATTKSKSNIKNWLFFSLSITVLLFTDYFPVFLLPAYWILPLGMRKNKSWWYKLALSFFPMVVFGFLWFPTLFSQISGWSNLLPSWPEWRNVAGGANIKQVILVWMKFVFGRMSLANKGLYYSLTVLASLPFILALINAWKRKNRNLKLVLLWLFVPSVLSLCSSLFFPAFNYFRLLYIFPAFLIIVAWGIVNMRNNYIGYFLLSIMLVFNAMGFIIYLTDKNQQREDWRGATQFVENIVRPGEIIIFEFPEPLAPYRWYRKNDSIAFGATDSVSATEQTTQKVNSLITGKEGVYYFEYLREVSDSKDFVRNTLTNSGFKVEKIYNFPGVGLIYHWEL